jgi:hypothetical protein
MRKELLQDLYVSCEALSDTALVCRASLTRRELSWAGDGLAGILST